MISKSFKTLTDIDGQEYSFDAKAFQYKVRNYVASLRKEGKKIANKTVIDEMAEKQCVSQAAIRNWIYGYNGPTDMDAIKTIASVISVDYKELLKPKNTEEPEKTQEITNYHNVEINELLEKMNLFNNKEEWRKEYMERNESDFITEKSIIREIYHEFVKFMKNHRDTDGFVNFSSEEAYYEAIHTRDNFKYLLQYYMLELPQTIYDELMGFYNSDMSFLLNQFDFIGTDINDLHEYYGNIYPDDLDDYVKRIECVLETETNTFKKIREILSKYIPEDKEK